MREEKNNVMNIETFFSTAIIEELSKKLPTTIQDLDICSYLYIFKIIIRKHKKYF